MNRTPIPRPPIHKIHGVQLAALLVVVAGMAAAGQAAPQTLAILLGGLTGCLPQAWYAWFAFRDGGARTQQVTARLIAGEAAKIGLAAVMCAMAFRWVSGLDAPLFFVALITMMVLGWWLTARVVTRKA